MAKNFFKIIFIALFFAGCANVNTKTKSVSVLIKSKLLKINDLGFVNFINNDINIQIYNSGKNALNLTIKDKLICVNKICQSQALFNQKFFLRTHYEDLLKDIILMKPIYNGKYLKKNNCGFEQSINEFLIQYKVCGKDMEFIDTKNNIKIKIKELF